MEYFVISAKFVPLKYYTLSSQLQRLTPFSVAGVRQAYKIHRTMGPPVPEKIDPAENVQN